MTELNLRYSRSAGKNGCLSLLFHASSVVVCSTDIVVKQTGREGCWHTIDIQTRFHSFLLLLVHLKLESKWTQGLEVAPIQSPNCADWHSKHLRVRISGCPPPDDTYLTPWTLLVLKLDLAQAHCEQPSSSPCGGRWQSGNLSSSRPAGQRTDNGGRLRRGNFFGSEY